MAASASERRRNLILMLITVIVIVAIAGFVVVRNHSGSGTATTDYATAENLDAHGADMLRDRWRQARENCDLTEMQSV
ncbi:MAG: hypothetical protein QM658_15890, partial [Gordonia sp. (in: high G+C Gram-positive bacteria)]